MPAYEKQDYWIKESIRDQAFEDFYAIGKELGRGATSCVFKCAHRGTGMNWAVKIITKNVDKKVVSAEIGILLQMDDPYVIRLKEVFETPTQIFMILELVTGGELFDSIVSRGTYSEQDAAMALKDILSGVEYLHSRSVVHRDLKPENLLYESMTDQSKLKIADFGLSRVIESEVKLSTVCGTPGYCAPEVLLGKEYNEAADLWSVGVIAYILLCGYEPFYSENETEMYRKIIKGDFKFDEEWWSDISENAKNLVRSLLIVEPRKRLTARDALKLDWVQGKATKNDMMDETVEQIKKFNARRKLKTPLSYYDKFEEYLSPEQQEELQQRARALVDSGKILMAADDSPTNLGKQFQDAGMENTEENRRLYRELLFVSEDPIGDFVSGALLSMEALFQKDSSQISFVTTLKEKGIIPGIIVDQGVEPLGGSFEEYTSLGLDSLAEHCVRCKQQGAGFALWQCLYRISKDTPSYQALMENSDVMARFASICQVSGLVPVLEPKILSEGEHDLQLAQYVTEQALSSLFKALADHHVFLEGMLLRLCMVIAGQDCEDEVSIKEVTHATVTALKRTIPPAVAGLFSSCGDDSEDDTVGRLDVINKYGGTLSWDAFHRTGSGLPWPMNYSLGDAVQNLLVDIWQGKEDQMQGARLELVTRLKSYREASLGVYVPAPRTSGHRACVTDAMLVIAKATTDIPFPDLMMQRQQEQQQQQQQQEVEEDSPLQEIDPAQEQEVQQA
ncbi:hypothetical protein ACOMHN_006975 [Nucella lapillus]